MPFEAIEAAAEALQQAGLLRDLAPDEPAPAFTIPGSPDPERHSDMKEIVCSAADSARAAARAFRHHPQAPLVNIGVRPILWHLMRYYAHFGHGVILLPGPRRP